MDEHASSHGGHGAGTALASADVGRLARQATTDGLTGCAIGEVLGMVIAGFWGLPSGPAVALSVAWPSSSATA